MSKTNIVKPFGCKELYKFYTEQSPNKDVVDKPTFSKVSSDFNQIIGQYVLEGKEVKFPSRLGFLRIRKHKNKMEKESLLTDWKLTKQVGKIVKHLNDHTNGFFFRFYWDKKISNAIKQSYYKFYPVRDLKRGLAYNIKVNKMDYFE